MSMRSPPVEEIPEALRLLGYTSVPNWAKISEDPEPDLEIVRIDPAPRPAKMARSFDWQKATAEQVYHRLFGSDPDWLVRDEPKPWLTGKDFEWKSEATEVIPGLITNSNEWVCEVKDGREIWSRHPATRSNEEMSENDRRRELLEQAIRRFLRRDLRPRDATSWPTAHGKEERARTHFRSKPATAFFQIRREWELFARTDRRTGELFQTVKRQLRLSALPTMLVDGKVIRERMKDGCPRKLAWTQGLELATRQLEAMCTVLCEGNTEQGKELAEEYSFRQLDWVEAAELFQGDLRMVKRLMSRQAKLVYKAIRPSTRGSIPIMDFLEWMLTLLDREFETGHGIFSARAEQAEKVQGYMCTKSTMWPEWMSEEERSQRANPSEASLKKVTRDGKVNSEDLCEIQNALFFDFLNSTDFSGSCGTRNPDLFRKFSGLNLSPRGRNVPTRDDKARSARFGFTEGEAKYFARKDEGKAKRQRFQTEKNQHKGR